MVKLSSIFRRLLLVVAISFGLMAAHSYTDWFDPIENFFDNALLPVHWLATVPARFSVWSELILSDRSDLEVENTRLKQESLIHRGQIQRMADLAAENLRLRLLLNATELLMDSVLVTQVIGVSPSRNSHTLFIDRGTEDNVYIGQPILDAEGLMGQVIEVFKDHSVALLITDSTHAIPVQILRNGMRSIAEGTSDYDRLRLRFVSPTADIREGDQLVSSGLGGRFPVGYPVGSVINIEHKSGASFIEVEITPAAKIDRSKHLLLVFTSEDGGEIGPSK